MTGLLPWLKSWSEQPIIAAMNSAAATLAHLRPLDLLALWPTHAPLMLLHSGSRQRRWARWSVFALPRCGYRFDGRSSLRGDLPASLGRIALSHDPLRDLDAILAATRHAETGSRGEPFAGGWIGHFSYDLGRWIEPCAARADRRGRFAGLPQSCAAGDERGDMAGDTAGSWPLIELWHCPEALVFDHLNNRRHVVGNGDFFAEAVSSLAPRPSRGLRETFETGPIEAVSSPQHYQAIVERTLEYIRAGDIYQANLAQWFAAPFRGSTRALAAQALASSAAWFGAYLEPGDDPAGPAARRRIISMSPELLLSLDASTRRVITRPIKGTRLASDDPRLLRQSSKDTAELTMIVDLMRNDLGRVCEIGSVQVPAPRMIETHGTVHHGVAEITGAVRADVTVGDLLRAIFPGGSVTGAPKIRSMQIIDELEPHPRGPYCGCIGFISDRGDLTLNIAIRTMLLEGRGDPDRLDDLQGELRYAAGCGIVADSDPEAEYRESLAKTAVLRAALTIRAKPCLAAPLVRG